MGATVAVVYNSASAESKDVAQHYARQRSVPSGNLIGLALPKGETISRDDYRDQLETPLREELRKRELLKLESNAQGSLQIQASIRYIALCYGVPLRIAEEPQDAADPRTDGLPEPLRRDEASVDSELAALVLFYGGSPRVGPLTNPCYEAESIAKMGPGQGVLMVTRLDGPSPQVAKRLVDDALKAEETGLWGRAYFDLRNISSGEYKLGEDWIEGARLATKNAGFPTRVERTGALFDATYPMAEAALYAGWYASEAVGPFADPQFRFQPGAIAYHLHSFSASTVRSASNRWVGPLLARGAAATLGCVAEPYLGLTPNVSVFYSKLFSGFSFAEAAYAAQNSLSWQSTFLGDPLYRPFALPLAQRQNALKAQDSPFYDWANAQELRGALEQNKVPPQRILDVALANDDVQTAIERSVVTNELLGDLYVKTNQHAKAREAYAQALALSKDPVLKRQLTLKLANHHDLFGDAKAAMKLWAGFLEEVPEYAQRKPLMQRIVDAATRAGDGTTADLWRRKLEALGD